MRKLSMQVSKPEGRQAGKQTNSRDSFQRVLNALQAAYASLQHVLAKDSHLEINSTRNPFGF